LPGNQYSPSRRPFISKLLDGHKLATAKYG
jgi:hypothetical protein